ncbi:dihydroxyacetone kinase subunit DhaK [Ornithinimicrobium pratense]|uniref:Dihydroxyacetone kinase subunit DhaK n=1 Tax=Ornithinimicrobium pratense TaxID=2593973 RepID=A0A5J6V530_9MICO|nr:dihydroxyacetone kinase subunit DhaK [Ornithinimicrobium pratense]QFG68885.1 dihydroxyacetone kinase subunit DhaK [Ornithinimicrobium pratense]
MKKFINDPADVVVEALQGVALAHPDRLRVDLERQLVLRVGGPVPGKVGLLSGGGAGHEPLHSGFVGPGMLDAACCGQVFTSPVPDQILAAAIAVDAGAGVLQIVKNYTGDVLNFEMAAELAEGEGVRVRTVLVADDVAVEDSLFTAGRRGVGATVLVEKIVGAAAEDGLDLDACTALGEQVAGASRSMGIALGSCTVPAAGRPTVDLGPDEIEIGVGIHGEPGRRRQALAPARELAAQLVEPVVEDLELRRGERALVFLNGLGGTPQLELYLMFHEVHRQLKERGVDVVRSLVGSFLTSLDMAGCSLTLLRPDEPMLRWWDAPVDTPALRW